MRLSIISALALASVSSAESISTLLSTITTCLSCTSDAVAPSSFVYTNYSIPASTSSKVKSTLYEYETATANSAVDVTKTICNSNSQCYTTVDKETLTTLTTSVDGILTVITTQLPVTSSTSAIAAADAAFTTAAPTPSPTTTSTIPGQTIYDTVSLDSIVWKTITHCSDNACSTTVEKESLTTYTTTVGGVETLITTYCPETATEAPAVTTETPAVSTETPAASTETPAASTETPVPSTTATPDSTVTATEHSTTVVTITSCSDHKCTEVPVTTGVTVVTTTFNDVTTEYTTFCPLSSESSSVEPVESTTIPATTVVPPTVIPSSASPIPTTDSTINVITNDIVTETPVTLTSKTAVSTLSVAPTTVPDVTTYNMANTAQYAGVLGLIVPVLLAL